MMEKNNQQDYTALQPKAPGTSEKIEKMRIMVTDSEKCKEIAQKLCAYIAGEK